ncbi:uncharacterized protein LOC129749144 [Uranotaenia lowii]|uniref:uncharacterized protein LOC129749144 n=1 Tax=Uranotaenia lowii TaxID=190385 RepID=UPI00247A152B|nr:uncharacterized protein LOC129749144 [Uranotaenia lowii]
MKTRTFSPVWWVFSVLLICVAHHHRTVANFVAYDDDLLTTQGFPEDDALRDQAKADYQDAIDRLITHAFSNETTHNASLGTEGEDSVKVNASATDAPLKCAANRKPRLIARAKNNTVPVAKCCPEGEAFLHESVSKCRIPLRRPRLPVVSRELLLYDQSCYRFGPYIRHNLTVSGRCIGKHLVINDGAIFTVIQNGSLMVSNPEQMLIYRDFCLEETASSVLVAWVCDEIVFPDPFDFVDKLIIGSALVAVFVTVLLYGFERNFHTIFGKLVMAHAGLLFAALLLEAALTEFEEAFYSTIVYILIGASYVIFAAANVHCMISTQGKYQRVDVRNITFVAFGCSLIWLTSTLFTLYFNEKTVTLCTVFGALTVSLVTNLIVLRGIIHRRHHLLTTTMDSCYELTESTEYSSYVHHRKELTILSTFATILQLLHWILFAAGRYNLLYGMSWCALTIFAVFVCFRYRSITVLSGGGGGGGRSGISKVLRHRHHPHHHQHQQQGEPEEPSAGVPTGSNSSSASSPENGYNQLQQQPPTTGDSYQSSPPHRWDENRHQNNHQHHQPREMQPMGNGDNQKHALTPVAEEDLFPADRSEAGWWPRGRPDEGTK